MMFDLTGKTALVTGASGAIGGAIARALHAQGATVAVSGTRKEALESLAGALGNRVFVLPCDLADKDAVEALVPSAEEKMEKLDILIANAGILRDKTFAKMEFGDFQIVVDVHLFGTVKPVKAVWEIMRNQNYGRIVVTTSSSGLYGNFGQSNYGAAKLGLIGFMNTLKLEGQKNNVHVNAISPVAATRMTENLGMPAEVLIIHKARLAIDYLTSPVVESFNRAFRED